MQLKMIIKFNKCCINAVYLHAIICTFTNRNTTTRLVDYAQNLACVMCKKNEHQESVIFLYVNAINSAISS